MAKILVVEDDPATQQLYVFMFDIFGQQGKQYDVSYAKDAVGGLAMLASFQPDLVLLDLLLPDIVGPEQVLSAFLQATQTTKVPIIVLSARTEENLIQASLQQPGVKAYVTKPFKPSALMTTIDQALTNP